MNDPLSRIAAIIQHENNDVFFIAGESRQLLRRHLERPITCYRDEPGIIASRHSCTHGETKPRANGGPEARAQPSRARWHLNIGCVDEPSAIGHHNILRPQKAAESVIDILVRDRLLGVSRHVLSGGVIPLHGYFTGILAGILCVVL